MSILNGGGVIQPTGLAELYFSKFMRLEFKPIRTVVEHKCHFNYISYKT